MPVSECDVSGCKQETEADGLIEVGLIQQDRFLLLFKTSNYNLKISSRLCKKHYDQIWKSVHELLKGQ